MFRQRRKARMNLTIPLSVKIVKCLSASPAKMMTVEELTIAIGIVTYDVSKAF